MRVLSHLLKILILLILSLPVALVIMIVDRDALISNNNTLSENELGTVQQLLIDNDPRLLINSSTQNIYLTEAHANILLRYFFNQTPQLNNYRGQVVFEENRAFIDLSIPLTFKAFGNFINMRIELDESSQPFQVTTLKAGNVSLPKKLLIPTLEVMDNQLEQNANYQLFLTLFETIEMVNFKEQQASIRIRWNQEEITQVSDTARDLLITQNQQSRVPEYYQTLVELESVLLQQNTRRVSLNNLFQPLFQKAYDNVIAGDDPVLENRAIFIALSVYLTDLEISQVSGNVSEELINHQPRLRVVIQNRLDLAQHVVTSAAIASTSSTSVMELISIYKEVHDSRYRSGFSFDDITANQVGSAIGAIASDTQSTAHRLQAAMKDITDESDWMPSIITGESMSEQEFTDRYESRNSIAYRNRLNEIANAISSRPLFTTFNAELTITPEQ